MLSSVLFTNNVSSQNDQRLDLLVCSADWKRFARISHKKFIYRPLEKYTIH